MYKLNVLIAGSTGYIGIQLIKLLSNHKNVFIKYLCGNKTVGKKISYFDKSLKLTKLPNIVKFNKLFLKNVDLVFTALPNGEAQDISKHLLKNNYLLENWKLLLAFLRPYFFLSTALESRVVSFSFFRVDFNSESNCSKALEIPWTIAPT